MLDVHWTTDYEGVANSFGYHVHNSCARAAVQAAGVCLRATAPVAVHVVPPHRFEPVVGKKNIAYVAWEARELPELFRTTLEQADTICVSASFLLEPFQRMFPEKPVYVVPEGVDTQKFSFVDRLNAHYRPNYRSKAVGGTPFRFLWIGAPNARKGAMHVLEAWKPFADNDAYELYVKTSMPADAQNRVGVKRVGNIIYDDRRVSLDDLVGIYHRAHCFVFPSVGEGFGLTFAEALSTGLPAIYTPATALLDLAPPDKHLAYPVEFEWKQQDWSWKDADAHGTPMEVKVTAANAIPLSIAEAMAHVAKNFHEAVHRGRQAATYMRANFTWERCGRRLVEVIESLHPAAQPKELVHA